MHHYKGFYLAPYFLVAVTFAFPSNNQLQTRTRVVSYGGKQPNKQSDSPIKVSKSGGSSPQNFLGSDVKVEPWDNGPDSMFSFRGGGPIEFNDELNTDFGSSSCWDNSQTGQIKWEKATGRTNTDNVKESFGTTTGPEDDYLIAYSKTSRAPTDTAKFESCSIKCVTADVTVTLRYWTSTGVNLEVCSREVFFDDEDATNCQKLSAPQPGPATVTIKNMKDLSSIVIRASNFVDNNGGIAVIDDVKVTYTPCPETGEGSLHTSAPQPPPNPGPAPPGPTNAPPPIDSSDTCSNVICSFQHGICGYKDFKELGKGTKRFTLQQGRFHNRLTGINSLPERFKKYAAAYLFKNDVAGLETGPLDFEEDRILQFSHYEATQSLSLKVCLDDQDRCPFTAGVEVGKIDRQWKIVFLKIPKGTRKIYFLAQNSGLNEGAVGVSDIKLFYSDGTKDACPNVAEKASVLHDPLEMRNPASGASDTSGPSPGVKNVAVHPGNKKPTVQLPTRQRILSAH